MSPIVIAILPTLIAVAAPLVLWVLRLYDVLDRQGNRVDALIAREDAQRARAVASELETSKLRKRCACLLERVAVAERWGPGRILDKEAHPASRPALPPPESRNRA